MSDALTVHVNRESLHSLSVPDSFEASDSFDVVLVNHGESTHVHLHLDDALSEQAAVEAPNHHVEGGGERAVRVRRTDDGRARGNLKVVTAYGATTRLVDVVLTEPVATDEPVEVDEELAKPQPRTDDRELPTVGSVPLGPLLAASGAAVGLGVGAGAVTGSGIVAVAILGLVLLSIVVAVVVANRR
ncbi:MULTISPECIES: DUF7524 family protein [Haloarcula]|uniref:DUF7524 family protein n=1 Tax=Haloarcula TaxID=2237 RepID=UPI0023E79445|nr:hypothetical protein [Halomicroarcula sp. SHR3]